MRGLPVFATIIASAAILTMIFLGAWQLQRKGEKEAQLLQLAANMDKPAIAFPARGPVGKNTLYRKSSIYCASAREWTQESGKDAQGNAGYRHIALCASATGSADTMIVAGVSKRFDAPVKWQRGLVSGIIANEPDHRSILQKAFGEPVVLQPMLVSGSGLGGLAKASQPSPDSIANNHLLYAIQWFIFAFAAALIFLLAVRKRRKG